MKKTAIILITLLLLSSIVPYNTYANTIEESSVNSSEKVTKQELEVNNTDDQTEEGTNDKESQGKQEEQVNVSEDPIVEDENGENPSENKEGPNDIPEATEVEKQNPAGENVEKEKQEKTEEVTKTKESEKKPQKGEEKATNADEKNTNKVMMRSLNETAVVKENATSKLGHIRGSNVDIYKDINNLSSSVKASNYINAVYYIKQQAKVGGQLYYLLSTEPSRINGLVGWAKASDLSTHTHVGVDRNDKTFYIKGTGNLYDTAWGGSKNLVYNLSQYKGQTFKVYLTEKVGNNTWYRGKLNGKIVWIHSSYLMDSVEVSTSNTSRLGHLVSSNVDMYKDINNLSSSFKASDYINAVYYIKQQAKVNGQVYYLLSKEPSRVSGLVGWVKASDLSTHTHVGVDSKGKTFYAKGTGNAYDTAWGGSKNLVYDMSKHKGQIFKVDLTEKVGNNTWYRGILNGKVVWLHSSYVTTIKKSKTSKLGHIRSGSKIYGNIGDETSSFSSDGFLNAVYYIKKQAKIGSQLYYLISEEPSSKKGIVGWAKSQDLSTHSHVGVDKENKTFYVKGTGNSYGTAWGGSKDLVYNLSKYKDEAFKVHLTEMVGTNTWYRGKLNGRTVWIHESYLNKTNEKHSNYDLTLAEALAIQMKATPQTDLYDQYVHSDWIRYDSEKKAYFVTASVLNVRSGPGTNYSVVDSISEGDKISVRKIEGNWYKLYWVDPKSKDLLYYLDPSNFVNDAKQQFQFLDLSKVSNASATVLNNYLRGKGSLASQGQAFIDAGVKYGINDIYLVSHAILETGNGSSTLAKGVKYKGVTVYNMFGVEAYDNCAEECGAKKAYDAGWTTPYKAIVGGAAFIGNEYIKGENKEGRVLNTLYKMRWNPEAMAETGRYGKQYATDIGWASKQIYTMYNLYQQLESYTLSLDIPEYR